MRKLIFVGPERSGKTKKALEISDLFNKNEYVFIMAQKCKNLSKTIGLNCKSTTKLIVIDDPIYNANFSILADSTINFSSGKKQFTISPIIIVTTNLEVPKNKDYELVRFPNILSLKKILGIDMPTTTAL
jgi:hypothetical protein